MLILIATLSFFQAQGPLFTEQPGELEFSGRLIARPLQRNDQELSRSLESQTIHYFSATDEYILQVPEGQDENSYATTLLATNHFEYVHPDWTCYPLGDPNDPEFPNQWHHVNMESASAWDLITGDSNQIIAWADTGVDHNHPDLSAHLIPGYNAVDDLAEANGGDTSDIHGHGTHVAGCLGAIGNNGVGVAGVVWNMQLMPIRVSNSSGGGAYLSDILDGARWAADQGAKTVSTSYSGVNNASVGTTGTDVKNRGGLFFYAAGNSADNWSGFDYADTIVVGATDSNDNITSWSGRGRGLDLHAPGSGILSTVIGGGYQAWSGTSMATPLANGVAAMIFAANPYLTPDQVQGRLYASCDDLGAPGDDDTYGMGRVNLRKAVEAALSGDIDLSITNLVTGQTATATMTGAEPYAKLYVAYSSQGLAVNTNAHLEVGFALDSPLLLRVVRANGMGTAAFGMTIPVALLGQTFWVQALGMNEVSNFGSHTIR